MTTIRELFDPAKNIDRRIEKVITYETTDAELLKQEIREYVATESIQSHCETFLDLLAEGMTGGGNPETGIWVSGFYGSGKSSLTKYLGFALDPNRTLDGKPFREWLKQQLTSKKVQQRLEVVAKTCPATVIMLDLASEQLAGASLATITSVLYAKVMQWAGYSRDEKMAYLEFMLEKDGKLGAFRDRIKELSKGKTWDEIKNQPLVTKALAAKAAVEFYPDVFDTTKTFNEIKVEELVKEDERVKEMLGLIERKTGNHNVLFILDEVGQYVAASTTLILNLDGLAKNIKNIGRGSAWLIATAQQTLTEDDPRAITNSPQLFKLKDRFPVTIDLEASDIKEICYNRLLGKSKKGRDQLEVLFEKHGPQCRHATDLRNTRFYASDLTKDTFCRYYPFLPQHFDILLKLLGRLARTRGGVGLRSAIKVIQDVLTDAGHHGNGQVRLADAKMGTLATAVNFFDTLKPDIRKPFPHIIEGVEKVAKGFGADSPELMAAKGIAVLQILEDFPVSRENLAALLHPTVDSPSQLAVVEAAVKKLLEDKAVPVNEIDGSLRFMSAAVLDLDRKRNEYLPTTNETRKIVNGLLKEVFTPLPSAQLEGGRRVGTGIKVAMGSFQVSVAGDKEPIQTVVDFVPESALERARQEKTVDSQQREARASIFLLGHEDPEVEALAIDIQRSLNIYNQYRNQATDKDVEEYVRAQQQRAGSQEHELQRRLTSALTRGSFIFRGKPKPVASLDTDLLTAARKFLGEAAGDVYEHYAEAPVQAPTVTAENFLKTADLQRIASKDDPLNLVNRKGANPINVDHKALLSIRNFLEKWGSVDGHKLLEDFSQAPYGWSKDTTRYLLAALLVAGQIKLRVAGTDVTTRGELAVNSLKNTVACNRIGLSLRDRAPDQDSMLRARERLLQLTGQEVLPLEEEINRCVMRHFPDYQQDYAPLQTKLENLGLPGQERAQSIQDGLAEILKGDASDATARLGGAECPFFDDLNWARAINACFKNQGFGELAGRIRSFLHDIPQLPDVGVLGKLQAKTADLRDQLQQALEREDFHDHLPEIKQHLAALESQVEALAGVFLTEEQAWLADETGKIQSLPEWSDVGADDRGRLSSALEKLKPEVPADLGGIKKLLNQHYTIDQQLRKIRDEARRLAAPPPVDPGPEPVPPPAPATGPVPNPVPQPGPKPPTAVKVPPPPQRLSAQQIFTTPADLDRFIEQLSKAKAHLEAGGILHIDWS